MASKQHYFHEIRFHGYGGQAAIDTRQEAEHCLGFGGDCF